MTDKQRKFAECYVKHYNAVQAAEEAGYNNKNRNSLKTKACKLKKHPEIAAYIKQLQIEHKSKAIIGHKELKEYLTSMIRGEVTEEKLFMGDKIKTDVPSRDKLKAVEIMCKIYNMFEEEDKAPTPKIIFNDKRPEGGK